MVDVSVIVNAHNSEAYLGHTLQSVVNQNHDSWECVVWDNASTDSTPEIVADFSDSRIRYFHDPNHSSLYQARFNALQHCQAPLVAFLDHDDAWLPNKLSTQLPVFVRSDVVASSTDMIVNTTRDALSPIHSTARRISTYRRPTQSQLQLSRRYRVGMSTLMVRTEVLQRAFPYPVPPLTVIEDFDMVFRLLDFGFLWPIAQPLTLYRLHGENYSLNGDAYRREVEVWTGNYQLSGRRNPDSIRISNAVTDTFLRWRVRQALLEQDRRTAWNQIARMTLSWKMLQSIIALLLPKPALQRIITNR